MDVAVSCLFFLVDEQSHLLGVGRSDLFADEDVGEGLVVVEQPAVGVREEEVVVELLGHQGGVFNLGQDVFEERPFFIVGKYASILEQVYHLRY